jgi:hypothetical protein
MKKSLLLGALAIAILLMAATYAVAADTAVIVGTGGASKTASDTVTVKATVNPKLVLTVVTPAATQTVDFTTVDPGSSYGPQAVNLTVSSNKTYNITKVTAGQFALMGLSTDLANSTNNAITASQGFVDNYSLNVPWTTGPGAYTATVQYTVVQN